MICSRAGSFWTAWPPRQYSRAGWCWWRSEASPGRSTPDQPGTLTPPVRGIYDLSPISRHCCQTRLMAQILCPVVIGRDAELEAVDAALTAAVAGHGGCVV